MTSGRGGTIHLGAACLPIADQLTQQGLRHVGRIPVDVLDKLSHAANMLYVHDMLTDKGVGAVRARIVKQLKLEDV